MRGPGIDYEYKLFLMDYGPVLIGYHLHIQSAPHSMAHKGNVKNDVIDARCKPTVRILNGG